MTAPDTSADRIRLLRSLRAVRDFQPDPVPQPIIDDLLEVARWTGSAKNLQPWDLVVIRDRTMLEKLGSLEGYVAHLKVAPLAIALVMDGENPEFATYDEGRLAERIMLAAAAHGLGSCIGWWSGSDRETARTLINAPVGSIVRTAISVGYPGTITPDEDDDGPGRKPLAAFVHQERYS